MKKVILTILLAMAGVTQAVTNTPTQTPTWTATVTPTLTPTYTEMPIARRDPNKKRIYVNPLQIRASNDLSTPALTPTPGGIWVASTNTHPYFVMGTGTAGAEPVGRFRVMVPVDYQKPAGLSGTAYPLTLWLENSWASSATNTVQLCVNVYGIKANSNFSNAPQRYTALGVTFNTQTLPNSYALSQITSTARLVKCTMPLGITQVAAGDDLTVEIVRSGASGNLSIGGVDLEYNPQSNWNP